MLLCHFIACFWIFLAKNFEDPDGKESSWIDNGDYDKSQIWSLYVTSFYFAVTSITTVGFGDIGGNKTNERIFCFFLHLIGVLSYSYAAGSLTSIIINYDNVNDKRNDQMQTLNRLLKSEKLPSKVYWDILKVIRNDFDPQ